jgi:NTE family protein
MTKIFTQRKKLGLALGSGGWRGQAHIGVIKTLIEAGINIDYIAGTSSGAMVGGAYAALQDITLLEKAFKEKINKRSLLYAFSDPKPSWGMFRGGKVIEVFEYIVGQKQI